MLDEIIAAKQELYNLGREAEQRIIELTETEDRAIRYRLMGMPGNAQFEMTQYALLGRELEKIGKRQNVLIGKLMNAGEAMYLYEEHFYE